MTRVEQITAATPVLAVGLLLTTCGIPTVRTQEPLALSFDGLQA